MGKWGLVLGLVLPLAAQAQGSLAGLDRDMAGARSQVLVLGTVHLSQLPKSFNPAALDGVLTRLEAFRPDVITIESLPGEECDLAARQPAKYGADYCEPTDEAKAATGLDLTAAIAEVHKTLKAWPAQPSPAQRRHLAALFLAANERASAYVQWLQLPESERRASDGLNSALVNKLNQLASNNNEDYQIAARLAARLGLQRVHAVDNHTGDNLELADVKAFGASIEAAWKAGGAALQAQDKRYDEMALAADLLPLYRQMNQPADLLVRADGNVRAALRGKSAEGYPQMWVAGWEIRNLRMVANIRETFRERPGARVLSIVGVTHKPWFDAWLGQLQGVEIVDVAAVLK
ncbi:hypothetical protein SAMN05216319_0344 [Duganella sp. CF402]|uniref:DUF5694 domain-containing protein n=1 Tax=unclassified Duganella TaxID=2636909 RepID=UPI0008C17AC9|nr:MULTISPECIES: DUF5694 domain-containing protein [unclassified Duganella]RZT11177.1 hypothetical protein EV582_3282 [Duganella sp. BK701]SEK77794.1 hypothetical protein SAMN05216319_0344 [Duganella sp. CF402]